MAIKKATTTEGIAPAPEVSTPKTVKVTSPSGSVTEVPEGIVETLLGSGYTKSK